MVQENQLITTGECKTCPGGYVSPKFYNNERGNNMINFKNELMKKLNFDMEEIVLFDSFAGVGALHSALKALGVPVKLLGLSEVDVDAIIAYAAIHIDNFADIEFEYPEEDKMREWLIDRGIGWDFKKEKSSIPRLKKDKLYKVYKACMLLHNFGDISKIQYEWMPDFDLFNFSFPCFVAGTLILTDKGYKPIEAITDEDYVLTHTNTYQKVVKPMINTADHIYRLKTMCSEPMYVTEEHPFYVRKRRRINTRQNGKSVSYRTFDKPEWVKTKDLNTDYYVGVAINKKSELPTWDGCVVPSTYKSRGHVKILNNLQNYFNNKDFWWIVGRYIGDGWVKNRIDDKGTDIYDLYICCAKNELHEITDVLDRLNVNNDFAYKYYEDRSTYRIRIANVEFAKYLQQFGKYAHGKHLTNDIFDLPEHLLTSFMDGYVSADGCFTQNRYKCSSVSRELIYGIGQCVAKAYKVPYSIYYTKRKDTCVIEGRTVNQRDSYSCCWKLETKKQDKAFYEDGYIWAPINDITREAYNGLVYNMEVEHDNSYTANGIIVHNCTDLSAAGKQQGLTNEDGTVTRSGLVKYGLELIKAKRPKYIMIENVKGLITKKFIGDFENIINEIESYGYKIYYPTKEDKKGNKVPMCLNAKNYGIPQNRERIFVICVRNDCNDGIEQFWEGKDFGFRLKDFLENTVDEKYFLSQQIQDRLKLNGTADIDRNDINSIGSTKGEHCTRLGERDIVYGNNGVSGALTATDYKQPKQIIDEKYYLDKEWHFSTEDDLKHDTNEIAQIDGISYKATRSISDPNKLCRTLDTMGGGQREPKVLEEVMVATCRGRYTESGDIEQRLEFNTEGTTNTLTSVQKDNYVVDNKIHRVGQVSTGNSQCGTVYDDKGVFAAVCAGTHGYSMGNIHSNYRIRKLTPKECWRLMGFTDEQFERARSMGISDSALYKQAGNSIVVNCLYYIFKELFKQYIIK